MKERLIQTVILLLAILAVIFLFQKEILNFLGGLGQNIFIGYLKTTVIFLGGLAVKAFALIKSIFSFLADLILKVVGNTAELYKLINGIFWLFGKLFELLKNIFGAIVGSF